MTELVRRMLSGDRQALAKLFSLVEGDVGHLPDLMEALRPHSGRAYRVGVTGPPGAGKSTLIDGLVQQFRGEGSSVGVLAVDPTSPFTGGAVLGDRVRMQAHSLDPGVFIRSLATRGAQGGLSRVIRAAVALLDANGRDVVMVESVGVGQTELDIAAVADTVVVTVVPEAGDAVQVMKAGLMEIGDVFVVNKADRGGANRLAAAIRAETRGDGSKDRWTPPVLLTQAHKGEGIERLHQALAHHRAQSQSGSQREGRRSQQRRLEFIRAIRESVEARVEELALESDELGAIIRRVESGDTDPYSAAAEVLGSGDLLGRLAETPRELSP